MNKRLKLIFSVLLVVCLSSQAYGETVYFLVAEIDEPPIHNDSYVLPLTDPCDIAHARDLILIGPEIGKALVFAAIDYWDPNNGINANRDYRQPGAPAWSWQVTDLIEFTDATIEIFDGTPTWVEADLDGWMEMTDGKIGFWGYTVVADLGANLEPWNCDLDVDSDVDLHDLELFTRYWLESGCGHRYWCGGADLNGSGAVDMNDFAIMARNWLWGQERIPAVSYFSNKKY